jgi:disulfide bond formation protein DsbB
MDARIERTGMDSDPMGLARTRPITAAAFIVVCAGAATILGAWFFQYGLGLKPCPLCLEQRYAYYFGIPLAVLLIVGESVGAKRKVLMLGLIAIAAGMLWNAGLGTYHAGIEWKLWAGPTECSGSLDSLGGSLLDQLKTMRPVRCDEAAWRFLGISLAGYNAVISLALAIVAAAGTLAEWRRPQTAADSDR